MPSTSKVLRKPFLSRRLVGAAIVLFWVAMMGWLVARNHSPGSGTAGIVGAVERLTEPTDTWLGLFMGEQKVGFAHMEQTPANRGELEGVEMELTTRLDLQLFGKRTALEVVGSAWRAYGEPTVEFDWSVRSAGNEFLVAGKIEDGQLKGTVTTAGEEMPLELNVGKELIFGNPASGSLSFPTLAVGRSAEITSFDPLSLKSTKVKVRAVGDETLEVRGKSVEARLLEVNASGMKTRVWIDQRGEVLQAVTPLGLTLRAIEPDAALASESRALDPNAIEFSQDNALLEMTAIKPTGLEVKRGATQAKYLLKGPKRDAPPNGAWQRATTAQDQGFELLIERATKEPLLAPAAPSEDDLAPDALIQSEHPKVRNHALQILSAASLSEESPPEQKALALHDWVFEQLEKEPVLSVPSALEVLEQKKGDCNEHTVLYVALARALDLPSRIAIGLVWSDTLSGFYYHAWPEVYMTDRWQWIDPTLGQAVADATHIKLLNGGIQTWTGLLPWLGSTQIEVLELHTEPTDSQSEATP